MPHQELGSLEPDIDRFRVGTFYPCVEVLGGVFAVSVSVELAKVLAAFGKAHLGFAFEGEGWQTFGNLDEGHAEDACKLVCV